MTQEDYLNRGHTYYQEGNYDKAIECFEKAIELNPDFAEANGDTYYSLGNIYYVRHDFTNALLNYTSAYNISPNDVDYCKMLGMTLYLLGRKEEAKKYLESAINLESNDEMTYSIMGTIYLEKKDFKNAVTYYLKAISFDDKSVLAHSNLGLSYCHINELEKGITHLKKALKLDPKNSSAKEWLQMARVALKKREREIANYLVENDIIEVTNEYDGKNKMAFILDRIEVEGNKYYFVTLHDEDEVQTRTEDSKTTLYVMQHNSQKGFKPVTDENLILKAFTTLASKEKNEEGLSENKEEIEKKNIEFSSKLLPINEELKRYFSLHPEKLYNLHPRKFEELVADILKDFGFDVELTSATRDGGFDIYAYMKTQIGIFLTFVECKRWKPTKPVGIEVVQRLQGVQHINNAHKSMIVTTSYFSQPAILESKKHKNLMELVDYNNLKEWLERYQLNSH